MLKPTVYLSASRISAFLAIALGACSPYPQRIHEEPVLMNGDRVPASDVVAVAPNAPPILLPAPVSVSDEARRNAAILIKEGDDLIMANDLDGALNRYDRASVLDPEAREVQYKAARLLDLQMRPKEALMRYKRFLHGLDLEKIQAQGDANAKLAEAIALAQQRIVVLEKQNP
jgi:tetratricopeptide (TPR) repeat protein